MVTFEIVVVVVCVVSALVATAMFLRVSKLYDQIGRLGGHSLDHAGELGDELVPQDVDEMQRAISAARRRRTKPRTG
jgi:hypothetical protein